MYEVAKCKHCEVTDWPCILPCKHVCCFNMLTKTAEPRDNTTTVFCPYEPCRQRITFDESGCFTNFLACYVCLHKVLREKEIDPPHPNHKSPGNALALDVARATWFCKNCCLFFCDNDDKIVHEENYYKEVRPRKAMNHTRIPIDPSHTIDIIEAMKLEGDSEIIFQNNSARFYVHLLTAIIRIKEHRDTLKQKIRADFENLFREIRDSANKILDECARESKPLPNANEITFTIPLHSDDWNRNWIGTVKETMPNPEGEVSIHNYNCYIYNLSFALSSRIAFLL